MSPGDMEDSRSAEASEAQSDFSISETNAEAHIGLIDLIEKGDGRAVEMLLQGDDPDIQVPPAYQLQDEEIDGFSNGLTPLMIAAALDRGTIVKLLLAWMNRSSSPPSPQGAHEAESVSATQIVARDDLGNTALHIAAVRGHDKIAGILLDNYPGLLEEKDHHGRTALISACMAKQSSVVDTLLDRDAQTDVIDYDGHMAIHHVSWHGSLDNIQALLKKNPKLLEVTNIDRVTALHNACHRGDTAMVQYLLDLEANFYAIAGGGDHIMWQCSFKGHYETVKLLLARNDCLLEYRDRNGFTPLLCASLGGQLQTVELLIDAGADRTAITVNGETALHFASEAGSLEVFERVLKDNQGILDVGQQDGGGRTPLLIAAKFGRSSIVKYLLDKENVDAGVIDLNGDTALHLASRKGCLETVGLLSNQKPQDFGLSLGKINNDGRTPFLNAVASGNPDLVEFLLKKEPNRTILKDYNGDNILHLAVSSGNDTILRRLLPQHPKLVNQANNSRKTPFLLACVAGNLFMVKYLLENNADVSATDDLHDSALHLASWGGRLEVVQYLLQLEGNPQDEFMEKQNSDGRTPLLNAAHRGHFSIVQFLLETKNAESSVVEFLNDDRALHLAASSGSLETVQMLFNKDPSFMEERNGDGKTPLLVAATCGESEIFDFLLKNGTDSRIMDKDDNDDTALHLACASGNHSTVRAVLEKNESLLNEKNKEGKTPMLVAGSCWNFEIVRYLSNYNQDLNVIDEDENNILHKVSSDFRTDLVCWALEKGVPFQLNSSKRSPLHIACYNNCPDTLAILLASLPSEKEGRRKLITARDSANDTPLSDASGEDDIPSVLALLGDKTYFTKSFDPEASPLYDEKEVQRVSTLLSLGFQILEKGSQQGSQSTVTAYNGKPLPEAYMIDDHLEPIWFWAILNGCSDLVKMCHGRAPGGLYHPLELLDPYREGIVTPLQKAIDLGHVELVKDMIDTLELDGQSDALFEAILRIVKHGGTSNEQEGETMISLAGSVDDQNHRDIEAILWRCLKTRIDRQVDFFHFNPQLSKEAGIILELAAHFEDTEEKLLVGFIRQIRPQVPGAKDEKNPLHLAIHYQLDKVLWCLLSTRDYISDKDIGTARSILDSRNTSESMVGRSQDKTMRMLLDNPPVVHVPRRGYQPDGNRLPQVKSKREDYKQFPKATIVDFYHHEDGSADFQRKRCDVSDIIFKGPEEIMSSVQKFSDFFPPNQEKPQQTPAKPETTHDAAGGPNTQDSIKPEPIHGRHGSLTLDQYYYVSLQDTNGRDRDQVLGRFVTKERKALQRDDEASTKILIVQQLWLWVLDRDTIITTTTQMKEEISFFEHVLHNIKRHKKTISPSINDITRLILSTATGLFEKRGIDVAGSESGQNLKSPLEVYRESILNVRNEEKQLFDEFNESLQELEKKRLGFRTSSEGKTQVKNYEWLRNVHRNLWNTLTFMENGNESPAPTKGSESGISSSRYSRNLGSGGHIKHRSKGKMGPGATDRGQQPKKRAKNVEDDNPYGNIAQETKLLREVKDICDELNILKNLAEDQKDVWEQFQSIQYPERSPAPRTPPDEIIDTIQEMIKEAKFVYNDLKMLLDLKQKQANIAEAQSTRKQSSTVMVFTVITILFLPASFLTSLFALNVSDFPHDGDTVSYRGSWIFPIIIFVSLATSAIFSLIAFKANSLTEHWKKWQEAAPQPEDQTPQLDLDQTLHREDQLTRPAGLQEGPFTDNMV
ncbi:ankyrin [Penicillium herquei]|nr:ankyrin [Penicillium herquei]